MPFSFGEFITGLKQAFTYGVPKSISTHGADIDRLIDILHWFMAVLFVSWGIYLIYVMIKFRDRPGHVADTKDRHFSLPKFVEIGVVVVEVVLLVFFSGPIWARVKTDLPSGKCHGHSRDGRAVRLELSLSRPRRQVRNP